MAFILFILPILSRKESDHVSQLHCRSQILVHLAHTLHLSFCGEALVEALIAELAC